MLAGLQFALNGFHHEALDIVVRNPGEKEELVKISMACELCLLAWQAGVLYQFSRRERAQPHDRNVEFAGERLQGLRRRGKGLCDGHTGESPKTHPFGQRELEIAPRETKPAAAPRDDRLALA